MTTPVSEHDFTRLRPRLLRRARRYAPDPDAAEDLVQEAVLQVWLRLKRDPPITDLERYLFRTLRNLASRQPPRFEPLDETELASTAARPETVIEAREVLGALTRLPPAQASLILAHAVDGTSFRDLARRHALPEGPVMSRVARGRAWLKKEVG